MKQLDLNNAVPNQNSLSIKDASNCGMNQLTNRAPSRHVIFQSLLRLPVGWRGGFNIFLIQNKGKGPPGCSRSPAVGNGLFPDHPPDDWIETLHEQTLKIRQTTENFNTEYQTNYKNINANILQTLNFTNMKKQILFLAFFILAALVSVTSSYGQAVHQSVPIPLGDCKDDALHPVPGRAYTYAVTAGTATATDTYTWWATKDNNFISSSTGTPTTNIGTMLSNPDLLGTLDPNYGAPGKGNTVSITWSSQLLAATISGTSTASKTPTFVVVKSDNTCTDNLKVYQLDPVVAFTVDILPMNIDGTPTGSYSATISDCFDNVASATYSPTTNTVAYDFGTNVLYYEVVATNFNNFFNAYFNLDGLYTGQSVDIDWSYTTGATATYTTLATAIAADGSTLSFTGTASASTTVDTSNGVSIYVRVTVHNGNYEGIVDSPITLAVNAIDSEGNEDLNNSDCTVASPNYEDLATQTLNARPIVNTNTPGVTPNPNPGEFIPQN